MHPRRLIALLVVLLYLLIPLQGALAVTSPSAPSVSAASSPQDAASLHEVASAQGHPSHCPCSDRHGSDGCNPGCFCCSCSSYCSYLPSLASGISVIPTVAALAIPEPSLRFPQVYLSIFVPPQNRA